MDSRDRKLRKKARLGYEIAYAASLVLFAILLSGPSFAQSAQPAPPHDETLGPYSGEPLPRFASLKADKVHLRRGPSIDHPIDWVLTRRSMPVLIFAEHNHWRRVKLIDGSDGWIHRGLLTGRRYVAALYDDTMLREDPKPNAHAIAKATAGTVMRLDRCDAAWCYVEADGYAGWAQMKLLWGANPIPTR